MFFYMIWVLNFLMVLLSFCQGKSGSKHFSLGQTSLVAMEAKFFLFLKLVGVSFKERTDREGHELFLRPGAGQQVTLQHKKGL
jgi:hypothetical protein